MCTVVVLIRPGHAWPLLLAGNRDEKMDRPWEAPGRYWPNHPDILAGRDKLAGGTWLGVNAAGVVATVLNRPGSLGPMAGKRSRGELPLLALQQKTANDAVAALSEIPAAEYRPFNMIVADARHTFFLRGTGERREAARPLAAGVHMITSHDPDDLESPRIARHLPRFAAATPPDPDSGDWTSWQGLLSDRSGTEDDALNQARGNGYGTVSSACIGLPARGRPVFLFASGAPDANAFLLVG